MRRGRGGEGEGEGRAAAKEKHASLTGVSCRMLRLGGGLGGGGARRVRELLLGI